MEAEFLDTNLRILEQEFQHPSVGRQFAWHLIDKIDDIF